MLLWVHHGIGQWYHFDSVFLIFLLIVIFDTKIHTWRVFHPFFNLKYVLLFCNEQKHTEMFIFCYLDRISYLSSWMTCTHFFQDMSSESSICILLLVYLFHSLTNVIHCHFFIDNKIINISIKISFNWSKITEN